MDHARWPAVDGPLAPYADGFVEKLVGRGYAGRSVEAHLYLMARLSRWLDASGLVPSELGAEQLAGFLATTRYPRSVGGLAPLLGHLRRAGAVPEPVPPVRTAREELVERFGIYLAGERGLGRGTIVGYRHFAGLFLVRLEARGCGLAEIGPADINEFLLAELCVRSVASSKGLVTALRAFLRFVYVEGITELPLVGAVPAVASWGRGPVPWGIDARSVKRLLDSCDRRTGKGRRDFALLKVLSRLGMRAGEVAALELSDIDWRAGEVRICGKGPRLEQLPLPVDVGEAVSGYLRRGRPSSDHHQVFLGVLAPHRGLTVAAIGSVVHAACRRAGIAPIGTHRLRHSVASELLAQGAALPEIGQLLRHRTIAATSIYAKADTVSLGQLARPWPGGVA